jgi:hypothetical protein
MIFILSLNIVSDTANTIRACILLARFTQAHPKYCTSIIRLTMSLSRHAIQPILILIPHPPHGLLIATTDIPFSYELAIVGNLMLPSCSNSRYTSSHRMTISRSRHMSMIYDFPLQCDAHDDPPRIVRFVQYEELGIATYHIPQFRHVDLPIILRRSGYHRDALVPDYPFRRLYRRLIPRREDDGMTTGRESNRHSSSL